MQRINHQHPFITNLILSGVEIGTNLRNIINDLPTPSNKPRFLPRSLLRTTFLGVTIPRYFTSTPAPCTNWFLTFTTALIFIFLVDAPEGRSFIVGEIGAAFGYGCFGRCRPWSLPTHRGGPRSRCRR